MDRFVAWAKNHRFVAALLVVGIITAAVASFVESVQKVSGVIAKIVVTKHSEAAFDAVTREQVFLVAKLMDAYILGVIAAGRNEGPIPSLDERRKVEVELRSLLLRIAYRGLTPEPTDVVQTIETLWKKYQHPRSRDEIKPILWEFNRSRFYRLFGMLVFIDHELTLKEIDTKR